MVVIPAPHVNLAFIRRLPEMMKSAPNAQIIKIVRNVQVMVVLAWNAKTNSTRLIRVNALHVL